MGERMTAAEVRPEPIQAREADEPFVRELARALRAGGARLVGPGGEAMPLPEPAYRALRQAVEVMASGRAVSIVPVDLLLTTQQAADLLNVSRPYLIRLLEQGKIPFERVGTHRRIRIRDLLVFKGQRDRERRRHLDELTRVGQELGLYDRR